MKTSKFLLSLFLLVITSKLSAQGTLWGEASNGGVNGVGTMFKTNYDGTGFTKIKDFVLDVPGNNPTSRLAIGPSPNLNGMLFGYATSGGTFENGIIFKYDPATNAYTKVHDFNSGTDGAYPRGALLLYGTKFYGVTYNGGSNGAGTLFEFDPATNTVTKKVDFQSASTGATPGGYLTLFNNKLYGTTSQGGANSVGTLFEFDPAAAISANIVNKHDFNNTDGGSPYGELTVSGSLIYGTASAGGANHKGVIFEFDPAAVGSNYVKKVDFDGTTLGSVPRTGLALVSGTMYGTTTGGGTNSVGTIYAYVPGATTASKKEDIAGNYSSNGIGNLLYVNGLLYGGTPNYMFTYNPTQPAGSGFTDAFDYDYYNTGTDIQGGFMLAPSGKIYGLAWSAGLAQAGAIYEYDPASPINSTNPRGRIYFNTSSGSFNPFGGFTYFNGKLYGKTAIGGLNAGTIFEYNPANGNFVETTFKSSSQGQFPYQPVVAGNGKLYGTTGQNAIVYEYDPVAHTISDKLTLSFSGTNFTLAPNGLFYGITSSGGANNVGLIYEYDPIGNTVTKKVDLVNPYSHYTLSNFLLAPNGKLYSLCQGAGVNGKGFLLEYEPGAATVSKKYDFTTGITGSYLNSNPLSVNTANGKLYGVRTKGGANSQGSIIEYTLPSVTSPDGVVVEKYSFQLPQDLFPASGLVESGNGKFYGLLAGGSNSGNLYEFDPIQSTFAYKVNFTPADGIAPSGLSIIPDPQTITFNTLPSKPYGEIFKAGATASSGLPVTYTSSNTDVAIIKGDTIIVKGIGTTTITAYQKGNGGYMAAMPVQQTLTTTKASQTITYSALANKKLNDAPFTLSATTSSTLAVSYVSSNTTVATISGNTVTIHARGSTDIQANQPGNDNYDAATPVTQTLTVVNSIPTVANAITEQEAFQLSSFTFNFASNTFADADGDAFTYTATKFDGSSLPIWLTLNSTTRTFNGTPGVTDTTATIRLTANDGFGGTVTTQFKIRIKVITGVEPNANALTKIYPNPVHCTLTVEDESGEVLPVIVRSSLGEAIYQNTENIRHEVNALPWAAGLYIVEVRKGNVVTQTKIIKY